MTNSFLYQKSIRKLFKIRMSIYSFIWTILIKQKCKLWCINIGKKPKFIGNLIICKFQGSQITIGNNCTFLSSSHINFRGINHNCILYTKTPQANITIGDNCGFSGISIVCHEKITIGNNCLFGANVTIGDYDDHPEVYKTLPQPIEIKSNTWIGMNTCILKGVTIGSNVVIGANSVITKSIPDNVIAAGNPCKVIKQKIQ